MASEHLTFSYYCVHFVQFSHVTVIITTWDSESILRRGFLYLSIKKWIFSTTKTTIMQHHIYCVICLHNTHRCWCELNEKVFIPTPSWSTLRPPRWPRSWRCPCWSPPCRTGRGRAAPRPRRGLAARGRRTCSCHASNVWQCLWKTSIILKQHVNSPSQIQELYF